MLLTLRGLHRRHTPRLPVHDDYATVNAQAEASDSASVLEWYTTPVEFRQASEILLDGNYCEIGAASEQVYAFTRDNGRDLPGGMTSRDRTGSSTGPTTPRPRAAP